MVMLVACTLAAFVASASAAFPGTYTLDAAWPADLSKIPVRAGFLCRRSRTPAAAAAVLGTDSSASAALPSSPCGQTLTQYIRIAVCVRAVCAPTADERDLRRRRRPGGR